MPIYEYQCVQCAHYFDALQKMSDEPLVVCPACYKPSLKKLVSAPRFKLTGTGWYETDFKDSKKETKASSEESTVVPTETVSDTKAVEAPSTPEVKTAKVESNKE